VPMALFTGISILNSRATDNLYLTYSVSTLQPSSRLHSLFGGYLKIPRPKLGLLEPVSQTRFLLQSRLAPTSVSVYGSSILLVMAAPRSCAACSQTTAA